MIEFKKWSKIPRWQNEEFEITEKLDGTNACIVIGIDIDQDVIDTRAFGDPQTHIEYMWEHHPFVFDVRAQSRTRLLTVENDNYGFAQWVEHNKQELLKLGPGHHFGEWWGKGINRGYGLDEKIFSLFWHPKGPLPSCCQVVPSLGTSVSEAVEILTTQGSVAAPGYMRPEGFVMQSKFHGTRYKYILDK